MIRRVSLIFTLCLCLVLSAVAAPTVTLVLKNGERPAGALVYRHDTNFHLIVNGREHTFPQSDVAVVEFQGGAPPSGELAQLPASDNASELERNVIVLRDGRIIRGKLYDISDDGETVTINTTPDRRERFSASQIHRLYMNPASARVVYNNQVTAPTVVERVPVATAGTSIQVDASRAWTDTGITVRRGERVAFLASGTVNWGKGAEQTAGPDGSDQVTGSTRRRYPLPELGAAGLMGRVGNGKPFPIGANMEPILMPAAGRLSLGINDDNYTDNSGAFTVVIDRR